jgi:hypothetical protein
MISGRSLSLEKAPLLLLVSVIVWGSLGCGGGGGAIPIRGSGTGTSRAPLVVVSSALPNSTTGVNYSATAVAAGGTAPYTWSISTGSLPQFLSINSSTGDITGVTGGTGQYTFSLQVKDAAGATATQSFTITVTVPGAPLTMAAASLANGVTGVPYSINLVLTGGSPPFTWSISSGSLPPGLSLNAQTGTITGTPTQNGPFPFTVKVTDSASPAASVTQVFAITVGNPAVPLSIVTTSIGNGVAGIAYSKNIALTGGTPPYAWSVSSGALPPGLSLNVQTGAVTGTPTQSGAFAFTAKVTDTATPVNTATQALTITIIAPPSITTTTLVAGNVGGAYSATLVGAGGFPPYSWSITSGSLPTGLSLNGVTGVISGIPTTPSSSSFTVKLTDSTSLTATAQLSLVVVNGVVITTPATLLQANKPAKYALTLQVVGGLAPFTWTLTAGSLPPGLTLQPNGLISGMATALGTFSPTIQVTDSASPAHTDSKAFTLKVVDGFANLATCQLSLVVINFASTCLNIGPPNLAKPGLYDGTSNTIFAGAFGANYKRITPEPAVTGSAGNIVPDYAKRESFNADSTRMLLFVASGGTSGNDSGGYYLYDATTYKFVSKLSGVHYDGIDAEPVWDATNPDVFFYRGGMNLYAHNVVTNVSTVVHDFSAVCPTCTRIRNGDEGNPDDTRRFWAYWTEDGTFVPSRVIVYDKQTDTVVSNVDVNTLIAPAGGRDHDGVCKGGCIDWIGMSHSGNFVVVAWAYGFTGDTTVGNGNWVYDHALASGRQVCQGSSGHTDPAMLADGTDVFVAKCSEQNGINGYRDFNVVRMSDGVILHHLMIDDVNVSWHISARNSNLPGWVLFSWYYDCCGLGVGSGIFSAENNAINIETGQVVRLVHNQSARESDYFSEPHATVNRDFTKILWGSNWRTPGGPVDSYVIDLP